MKFISDAQAIAVKEFRNLWCNILKKRKRENEGKK